MPKVVKVPVVMQMEALECGAACLCMVLAYHGKWIPLEQARADLGVSRDGSSARSIVKAARNYGLKAEGYRMEPAALQQIDLPAILHWSFNHFVVLNGFKKGKAVLNDPGRGTVEVSLEEFDQNFTGIVLRFERTERFVPGGRPRSVWGFAKERLRGTAPAFSFQALTGLITSGIGMVIPLFSKVFLDNILTGKNREWLMPFTGMALFMLVFQFAVATIQGIYWLKIQGKLAVSANAGFVWHVLRLPVGFFAQRFTGDIVGRQNSNENIAATLIGQLAPVCMNVAMLALYLLVMLRYNAALSFVGIAAALINLAVVRLMTKRRINMSREMMMSKGKLSGVTMSGFEMMETIKAAGAESGFFSRWAGYYARQENARIAFAKSSVIYEIIPGLLSQAANIAVLTIGVVLILGGSFTIGMLMAFQGFLSSFLGPVGQLLGVGQSFMEMRSQMERVEDVMCYPTDVPDEEEGVHAAQDKMTGEISVEHLTFGYNKLSTPLIEDFSLHVEPGRSVAIVGGSGGGKSTVAKLIAGLYPPWSGDIRFGGLTRTEIDRGVFTGSLAVVDQDIVLFEDTVRANVAMWDDSIDEATIIAACKDAQIHEDIVRREGGYAHVIREGGKNFSGGQRQRFEIARVLAKEPAILILDEATSALDAKTEQVIMEAVKTRGITLILIAHRLSTIRDCDEIIVLDQGKVVERGRHEDLISKNGVYTQLVRS